MQKGRYTELFFWDEATALSAGHRPCAECQRDKFNLFKGLWAKANDLPAITTPEMDDFLHKERTGNDKAVIELGTLPDGTMIEYSAKPYLKLEGKIYGWGFHGYTDATPVSKYEKVKVLTPASIVKTLAAGYKPAVNIIAV